MVSNAIFVIPTPAVKRRQWCLSSPGQLSAQTDGSVAAGGDAPVDGHLVGTKIGLLKCRCR